MFWHHMLTDFANGYRGKAGYHTLNYTLPDFLVTKTHGKRICYKIGLISKIALICPDSKLGQTVQRQCGEEIL